MVSYTAYVSAVFCCGLAVFVLLRTPRTVVHWSFAAGMLMLAFETVFNALSLQANGAQAQKAWSQLAFFALAALPGPWVLFSLSFARDNTRFADRWPFLLVTSLILPVVIPMLFWDSLILAVTPASANTVFQIQLGQAGLALSVFFLIGAVAALMNLERTYRASVGTIRWRIKYILVGLGLFFIVRVFTSSQILLYHSINFPLLSVRLLVLPLACALILRSLLREGNLSESVYPSRQVLQNSVTLILAGVYLVAVGLMAKLVTAIGGDAAFPIKAFLVLVSLVGLSLLLLSERMQQQTRKFVSRHFQRPLHDYRKVWNTFTERTTSLVTEETLARAVARMIAETFQVLSVTVWLLDEKKERLQFAASTALSESNAASLTDPSYPITELTQALVTTPYPIDIDASNERWVQTLQRCNPTQFLEGGNRVCVPLVTGQEFLGVITLGDRVNGVRFTVEDFDLLKCIGDQVAANLMNISLSRRILQAKELEAFQTMSAFFVHDLKNTASTLSLMLQNLPIHFDDPAFRADALRAVSKSVDRINELISRVSLLRQTMKIEQRPADLKDVVENALAGLETAARAPLRKELQPAPGTLVDAEQMNKVVTNLILNAWDAVGPNGEVSVSTMRLNGWGVITITDNGCGMSDEFIRKNLFRPFQTTKKKGIGVGMFHCKAIIEAHRGRIEVQSAPGQGTTFRVLIPSEEK